MRFSCYTIDSKTGEVSPSFWLRALICLLIAFELFWYTSGFGAGFGLLFGQPLAVLKFLFLALGAVLVAEWVYLSVRWIVRSYGLFPIDVRLALRLIIVGLVVPAIFLFLWGAGFSLGFGEVMNIFVASVSLVKIVMFLLSVVVTCMLLHPPMEYVALPEIGPIEVLKIEAFYGGVMVQLLQADLAYIFYKDGVYYITSHAGVCYETSLSESFEELYGLLDPDRFFMINECAIVSKRACTGYVENEDGTIQVSLVPKPIIPKAFRGESGAPGVYDFLNWN
jgi:hypothetical protein